MSLSFTFFSSLQSVFSMSGAGVLFFLYRHGNVKNTDENSKNHFEFRHKYTNFTTYLKILPIITGV